MKTPPDKTFYTRIIPLKQGKKSPENKKNALFSHFFQRMFCQFKKTLYLCTRKREISRLQNKSGNAYIKAGPFVYRLGRKIFILERGVRFPQGLQNKRINELKQISRDGKS